MAGKTTFTSARARQARSVRRIRHANQQLVISSVRQHELTETAEKLNDKLQAEIAQRQRTVETLRESEQRFRALFELGPVAVYSCDAAGVIQQFNRRAAELWGREPAPGDTDQRFCGSDKLFRPDGTFMPHEQCPMAEVIAGKIPAARDAEVIIERPDGSHLTVIVNIRPLKNERGQITGAINCFYDITERKQAEQARAKLAAIVQSSDDAIISKDLNGIITSWNQGAERLFGHTAAEAIGRPITILMPPDRVDEEPGIIEHIRRGESVEHFETVRQCKNGVRIDVSITVSPIKDDQGKVIGASKIARDITRRKRTEESLRQAQVQLADRAGQLELAVTERTTELTATNSQLEAFIYSVAHDLRAPLRSMEGFSSMLVEEAGQALSKTGQNYAHRINKSAQFMDAMLIDMLAFSRISQQPLQLSNVNLQAVVGSTISRLEPDIQQKHASVEAPGPWPMVLAQQTVLEQILFNLVSNALKFVPPGTPPQIRLRAETLRVQPSAPSTPDSSAKRLENSQPSTLNSQLVRVWVEDNGIGILPRHHGQIFRLFNRLHGDKYEGTGIGLAIVQKGVQRMGGNVGVQSTLGQGSRFWIDLQRPTEPQ